MTEITRQITLPAQYAIEGSISGNPIRQLRRPALRDTFAVQPIRVRRTEALTLENAGGARILVTDRRAAAKEDFPELLYSRNMSSHLRGEVDELHATWLTPASRHPRHQDAGAALLARNGVLENWRGSFSFREERREYDNVVETGLRPPQVGALFMVLGHWKASSSPATVVMPTGTGKTETMLALLARERFERLLVIVPTNALREQVGGKFVTMGLLKALGVLPPDAAYPVVGFLERKPKIVDDVDAVFLQCNVIVTTMAIAGQCEGAIQDRMAALCSHLFIDEAHHISARTWESFRSRFAHRRVVQFTATPFRNDGKHVDGRIVFNYPLKKAQAEGYFKPIRFKPVDELDSVEADIAIAEAAIAQLTADRREGYGHLIMARCAEIQRAREVFAIYDVLAAEHGPVLLHNQVGMAEARDALRRMRAGEARIVVCVDMLGEGFDLPELKIAAIHDPHKSLAITLQFTGRFTRTRADLGDATMIANIADPKVGEALRDLYAEDADWNVLLRDLSEGANFRQARRSEFLDAFRDLPEAVSLRNIFPKMSAVVYRTRTARWRPEQAIAALGSVEVHAGPTINERDRVLLFITREHEAVPWGDVRDIRNTEWHLYLVHWDEAQKLLFINSSNNGSNHEELATAVAGDDVMLVRGETVFRSLHNVSRLVLTNLGLSDLINERLRFSLHVGADISDVLPEAMRMNKRKSNLFARGYEDGVPVTVGCSQKGRIWSMLTATDLSAWVEWCHRVGSKLTDEAISTADVFRNVILPRTIKDRPALIPLLVEWPESFLARPEDAIQVEIDGEAVPFYEAELQVLDHTTVGPLRFRVVTPTKLADYTVRFGPKGVTYESDSPLDAQIKMGRTRRPLGEWFRQDSPAIRFENGSYLEGDEFFELPAAAGRRPFDPNRIEAWDWTGVDLKKESQHVEKRPDSIQRRVIHRLLDEASDPHFPIVFDDDDAGEAADVVCIGVRDKRLLVHFYHCKFSGEAKAGARVDDLYAVCGQAQRSVHWRSDVSELFKHLRRREDARRLRATRAGKPHVSRFERGDLRALRDIGKQAALLRPEFRIFVVQPGLSRDAAVNKQLELLASTELYLMETSAIPLGVIASA